MVDCRTMLSALVAAYDQHRKWMMADRFAALQRAVDHARDVLAQPEPAPTADGEVPTDEQLDDLFVEIDGSGETQSWRAFARAVLACWGAAAPAADGEVAKLVEAMREMAYDASQYDTFYLLNRAADLLERQAAAAPVARLPEDAQVIEPANRTILVPVPAPIPVSERLPGPPNDGDCWWFDPHADGAWYMDTYQSCYTHWLPVHALPLPEVNDD